jgi:hypothetical protein
MKPKLSLTIAALLAAGGLWFAWSAWHKSNMGVGFKTPHEQSLSSGGQPQAHDDASMGMSQTEESRGGNRGGRPNPGQMPRPPEPNRRFIDFTPEQRVEFARKGHGPGG